LALLSWSRSDRLASSHPPGPVHLALLLLDRCWTAAGPCRQRPSWLRMTRPFVHGCAESR
jgi:hypothetical protein